MLNHLSGLRTVLIVGLVVTLARLPIPWVHSHDWMDADSLCRHLQCQHDAACDCAHACGLHIHVFCWGMHPTKPDGLNLPPVSSSEDYCQTRCVTIPAPARSVAQVSELKLKMPAAPFAVANSASGGCDSHLAGSREIGAREQAPDRSALCVYLI